MHETRESDDVSFENGSLQLSSIAPAIAPARRARVKKRVWVRKINMKRHERGEYHALIQEMRLSDSESFYKYFRMTPGRFDELLCTVDPTITRQTTNFRTPISPGEGWQ